MTLFCSVSYINGLSAATVLLTVVVVDTFVIDDGTAGDEGR